MDIQGKVFIVTGGASGLGEGTARMLAANGAKVVIADMQVEKGEAVAKELGGTFVKCDVSNEADGQAAVAQALSMGKLMGLVNCAGIAPAEKTVGKNGAHNLGVFSKTIMVNLVGTFNMIRLASEAMCKNEPEATGERGVLISTASVAAYDGQIGQAAYAASKFALRGFSEALRQELRGASVRIMVVHPGGVDTAIASSAMAGGVDPHEAARERKRFARLPKLSATQVAERILQALPKGRDRLVLGWDARLLDLMQRCFPQGHARVLSWLMRWGNTPRHRSNGSPGAQQQPGDGHG